MAQRRETKKAPPDDQTVHDERLASILDMTFEQQVDFLGKMHENDLRMSNTKAKPKAPILETVHVANHIWFRQTIVALDKASVGYDQDQG
ncbi:predicted protein [Sclerotinia sclerotiorum 1980 UF-70]|uniref:Uncharacterized protein n=1 Tax=Sclerotinia sclerotiorum (strain ATCC 18683 / 1980 / Ss-1) TaxID=665079 RepID=A7EVH7_SCLS1|nr:predicted protein [Sclerotinia sclerotiorum 1980 UF-70]EDN93469.1 predicted protein [Sclerotinia sclerotiorum 1980 UF-70]